MLLILVFISTLSIGAHADSFRCGGKVIRSGDSSGTLLRHCGEPRSKDSGREKIRSSGRHENVNVKRWHYKKSSRSLERIVWIYQGKIVAIKTGQR